MTPPAAAGTSTLPRTVVPRAPRRVSGPAPRPRRGEDQRTRRAPARRGAAADPFVLRALRRTRQLADSRFLDRLIRGRLWIPLVAVGLMGIVFMQVSMLKLNAGIGRAVQSSATLERQNSSLRAEVSRLESGSRIAGAAHDLGMVVPADGTTNYVRSAGRAQATTAAQRMVAADPEAIARAKAGDTQAQGQAGGTVSTGSATAAAPPVQAAAQAAAGTSTAPTGTTASAPPAATAPATSTSATPGTGTGATGAATTGGAATPPAVAAAPAGAATPPDQQQPAATTSGGAAAPAQG
jgi:cell division protein FtsL